MELPSWDNTAAWLHAYPHQRAGLEAHGADAWIMNIVGPDADALNEYRRRFGIYRKHQDNGLEVTPEFRYVLAGLIGGHYVSSISGSVVVPIRDGIDLPLPSGVYRVRVEYNYSADLFVVTRVHIVGGADVVEGLANADDSNVGELAYRASSYLMWNEIQWPDLQ